MSDRPLDERIAHIVKSVEPHIPAEVEQRIRAAAADVRPHPVRREWRRPFRLALVPAAASVIVAILLILPTALRPKTSPIAEIRTEFEIPDKNIKIIFIQKPDFSFLKEN
jgi:hypothetical protein